MRCSSALRRDGSPKGVIASTSNPLPASLEPASDAFTSRTDERCMSPPHPEHGETEAIATMSSIGILVSRVASGGLT
jgi:hypothetical protein